MSLSFHMVRTKDPCLGYIRARWAFGIHDARSTLGIKIKFSDWDTRTSRVNTGCHDAHGNDSETINLVLSLLEAGIAGEEKGDGAGLRALTVDGFRNRLRELVENVWQDAAVRHGGIVKHRLVKVYEDFVEDMFVRRNWTKATRINYRKLLPYLKETGGRLFIEDVNIRFVESFYKKISSVLTERTAHNMMTCLRSFLRWAAIEYGADKGCLSFSYKTRQNIKDMVYLSAEELQRLSEMDFPQSEGGYSPGELSAVRDMFLFCCLTGLRFSDMQRLEWTHVFRDSIKLYTKKTMKLVEVELNPLSKDILSRYDNGQEDGFVFPRIDNGQMNKVLKTIGALLGLDADINRLYYRKGKRQEDTIRKSQALTTHTGRHTFAVQALSSGVPGSVVMAWTGHSDYNSLKPYMDITSDAKKKAMEQFERYVEDVFVVQNNGL